MRVMCVLIHTYCLQHMRCPWWLMIDDSIEMSHVKTLKSDFECTPHISQAANNFPWSAQLAFAAFKIQYPYVITFMTWNHDFTLLCSEVWTLIHRSRRTQFIFVMSVPWSGALKETAVFCLETSSTKEEQQVESSSLSFRYKIGRDVQ